MFYLTFSILPLLPLIIKITIIFIAGEILHVLEGHLGVVLSLYIDHDKLISAGQQKKIMVWDYRVNIITKPFKPFSSFD